MRRQEHLPAARRNSCSGGGSRNQTDRVLVSNHHPANLLPPVCAINKARLFSRRLGFIYSSNGNPLCFKSYILFPFSLKRSFESLRMALSRLVRGGVVPSRAIRFRIISRWSE